MSVISSVRFVRSPNASIPQVVLGALVTLWGLFTVQFSLLAAYDAAFGPRGLTAQGFARWGNADLTWSQLWHEFGPLLWSVYAAGLLSVLAWMWRIVLTKPPRAGWKYLPFVLAVCAVFWALNLDRYLVA